MQQDGIKRKAISNELWSGQPVAALLQRKPVTNGAIRNYFVFNEDIGVKRENLLFSG